MKNIVARVEPILCPQAPVLRRIEALEMNQKIKADKIVDARETLCPGPFWELIKAYDSAKSNEVISLYSTESYDSDTKKDAPVWINKTGNKLMGVYDREGYYEIMMKKTRHA